MSKYIKYILALIVISIIGIASYSYVQKSRMHSEMEHQNELYTCSMHPQIISDKPGSCPICGMALVKKNAGNHAKEDHSIDNMTNPTDNFIVGNYQTTTAIDTILSGTLDLPGIVSYDPNSSVNIAARISGRIERMYVNYKYQRVSKGQKLFDLYSPELITEQQNFIYLITNDAGNTSIINAAKQKLLLYGMTINQINSLEASRKVNPIITIYSPAFGIILGTDAMTTKSSGVMSTSANNTESLGIKEGNYIKKGEVIFRLINTAKVWGVFNVLQGTSDLIKKNMPIVIISELDESSRIDGQINFIETQLNSTDKTNSIRVYLNNEKLQFPIGLRLNGVVKTKSIKGIWIQKQSMVSIGTKKIVFVKKDNGFQASAIQTGLTIDNYIQVLKGISVKDTIAKNAEYFIDSESFIKTE